MRVLIITFTVASLAAILVGAKAQTIVSRGVGLSHDCFIYAKAETDPHAGVDVCNQSLKREMLTRNDQAATYDNRGVMLDALGRVDEAAV